MTAVKKLIYIILMPFFIVVSISCTLLNSKILTAEIVSSGKISDRNLGEVSGIAVSRVNKGVLWVINDSGDSPIVYALNSKGTLLGKLNIKGVSNNDWEDLASFENEGKPYILIADVGDNFSKRSKCFLHVVEEPDLGEAQGVFSLSVKPSWSITYTYEDGPRDCESVAFDEASGKILLLTKRDVPPVLYDLPLIKNKNAVAKKLTEIVPLPQRTDEIMDFSVNTSQPTGMDISADGLSAVVITYGNAFLYTKTASKNWSEAFRSSPEEIIVPRMRQAESICFGRDGSSIFLTSEQHPAPFYEIVLKK